MRSAHVCAGEPRVPRAACLELLGRGALEDRREGLEVHRGGWGAPARRLCFVCWLIMLLIVLMAICQSSSKRASDFLSAQAETRHRAFRCDRAAGARLAHLRNGTVHQFNRRQRCRDA